MGRKRKKIEKIVKKTLPTLFECPVCGRKSIRVTIDPKENLAILDCITPLCPVHSTMPKASPVDVYCKFVDIYYEQRAG